MDGRLRAVWDALESVKDPEIPVLSVVDLGVIADVRIGEDTVAVDITPTFAGCPAIEVMKRDIHTAVKETGADVVDVRVVYDPPWTSERLTEEGRRKLKEFGLAPPGPRCGRTPNLDKVPCPFCDSPDTELESMFGPTLCRSIHYCNNCLQSFEHFKPV